LCIGFGAIARVECPSFSRGVRPMQVHVIIPAVGSTDECNTR
jgi:hypothetical protein